MNIVHLCDCMDFMKDIHDKYYELAIDTVTIAMYN